MLYGLVRIALNENCIYYLVGGIMGLNEALSDYGLELVPASEIQGRIEKFQTWLSSKNLNGAFLLQNVDVFYFSGTIQRSILFVPAVGEPLLMVMKSHQRARNESPLREVIHLKSRGDAISLVADFGYSNLNRIGLELDVLPTAQYLWFKEKLSQTDFTDISSGIRKLRMIKTSYEVNQIRRATTILNKGYSDIQRLIKIGMTELEIDGLLSYIARKNGHMGVMRMRGWNQEMTYAHVLSGESGGAVSCGDTPAGGIGNTPAMAQGAGARHVGINEPIYIDYGVAINGYVSDQTRTFVMGELDNDLARAHVCAREILEKLEAEARPGVPCHQLFDWAKETADKRGLTDQFMGYGEGKVKFIGHGIGLEIDELPIVAPGFQEPLEEGMVFALEPKFVFPEKGIVGIEDDYLVTASGLERLTLTDQDIIHIAY